MFFDGYPQNKGVCPKGGGHNAAGFKFTVYYNDAKEDRRSSGGKSVVIPRQFDWRFCRLCNTIFFNGYTLKGHCAGNGNGAHLAQGYMFGLLTKPQSGYAQQNAWRYCSKCFALFYDGYPGKGVCAGGGAHVAQGLMFYMPYVESGMSAPPPVKTASPAPNAAMGPFNAAILAFARQSIGRCVNSDLGSDCQCTRLVEAALKYAGARPGSNYVWGNVVTGAFLPGDIIQFFKATFRKPDGSLTWSTADQHTAIIETVENGTLLTLIHQNDGVKITTRGAIPNVGAKIDLTWKTSGTYIVYRAVAP